MTAQAMLVVLYAAAAGLLVLRIRESAGRRAHRQCSIDIGSSMTIGGREVQQDAVETVCTKAGTAAVLADGRGRSYGARIAARTAVGVFVDLFRDYNAFENPHYYFRRAFHAANRSILRQLNDEQQGSASVAAVMVQRDRLFYAAVGNAKICVFRKGDLVPLTAGHTMDVLARESFQTGRLSREEALVMLENHRLYNYVGQDGFQDIEIFDRPITLQKGDIVVLMSDGLHELTAWRQLEEILSGRQSCQQMAYAMMETVNQSTQEQRDNASVILLRWNGSVT